MQHLGPRPVGRGRLCPCRGPFEPGYGSSRIIELNHMFLRLCVPPSIPLSFTVAGVLPRWNTYRFRFGAHPCSDTHQVFIVYCVDYQGI